MTSPTPREQFLLISALGQNPMELTSLLSRAAVESRCILDSSRLSRHGEFCALTLQASGSWDALARMESSAAALGKKHGFELNIVRSSTLAARPFAMPYVAYINAVYRPDILSEICQFFINHQIELEAMSCDTYLAPHTGGTMLSANLTISLPPNTQINWLRDQFLDFADALNLDALIEPWRPQNP